MKEGWEYKKLGEVANFISGYTPNKEEISNQGEYPYFKVAEMNIAGNELYMKNTSLFVNSPKKIYPKGSIIFPKNGGAIYTEKKRILDVDSVIDLNTEAIFPTAQIELMYLYFLLTFTKISSFDKGGGLPSLDLKKMSEYIIPLPPLSEQHSIVDYLNSAFAKIDAMKANAEKALNEAKALFQASLKEMLEPKEGWEEKKLKEVVISITDGDHQPPPKSKDGIPFITISNIDKSSNKIIFEDTFYVPQSYFRALKKDRIPKNGDVLYTVTGSFGIPVLIDFQKEFCFQRHIALIRPNIDILSPTYLFYWILSIYATSQAEDTATGAAQRTVSLNSLRNFTIHVPPLSEQQSIVAALDSLKSKVDRLQANFEKISQECDALKQAILRKVFE